MPYRKKLIEVALPLEAINTHSAREKNIRHGHPSTIHIWWSRKPLAVCRAVLFASLVDDPSSRPDLFPTEDSQNEERMRLFRIMEDLVQWENSNNSKVLSAAQQEILKSTEEQPPVVVDPFCGGGSIPLEAARLGLTAHGGDINPVAVVISKAIGEIAQRFAGLPAIAGTVKNGKAPAGPFDGLAADVVHYGRLLRQKAFDRIGMYYPQVKLPKEFGGTACSAIAWLWVRTVICPNPACKGIVPLMSKSTLSSKKGREYSVVACPRPGTPGEISFSIAAGLNTNFTGTTTRQGALCIHCQSPIEFAYIRSEGKEGRLGRKLAAMVAEGPKRRVYVAPTDEQEEIALSVPNHSAPDTDLPGSALGFRVQLYGMRKHYELFTRRQLLALSTFGDLLHEVRNDIKAACENEAKNGSVARPAGYAESVATYLALTLDKCADYWSSLCTWNAVTESMGHTFTRQVISMVWDFAECCPFSDSTGNFLSAIEWVSKAIANLPDCRPALIEQRNAIETLPGNELAVICTDPPYYDNIGYSDLSDFFYIWLRRSLKEIYAQELGTVLVSKTGELLADATKFAGDKTKPKVYFEHNLSKVFANIRKRQHPDYPLTLFYAFKQTESEAAPNEDGGTLRASSGWETMLEALLGAGFAINGTWPVRSESSARLRAIGSNALASSIVLVCRPRLVDAGNSTRREFISELKRELPDALRRLQHGNVAPVDLAQASIGPGMSIFSRYQKVLESDGSSMTVRSALAVINQVMDEVLSEFDTDYDPDTRWAISWFDQYGYDEGVYGIAETLSKAKNTSVEGLVAAGIVQSRAGKVRLYRRDELPLDWDPTTDKRVTIWETTQHTIRLLESGGISEAAALAQKLGNKAETALELAYRLYSICERNKWSNEAVALNSLVAAWPDIREQAVAAPVLG